MLDLDYLMGMRRRYLVPPSMSLGRGWDRRGRLHTMCRNRGGCNMLRLSIIFLINSVEVGLPFPPEIIFLTPLVITDFHESFPYSISVIPMPGGIISSSPILLALSLSLSSGLLLKSSCRLTLHLRKILRSRYCRTCGCGWSTPWSLSSFWSWSSIFTSDWLSNPMDLELLQRLLFTAANNSISLPLDFT